MASMSSGPCHPIAGSAPNNAPLMLSCRSCWLPPWLPSSDEIPGLGQTVAFDVTHIYAWVKENNPRQYVANRYAKDQQPKGDPDCRSASSEAPIACKPMAPSKKSKNTSGATALASPPPLIPSTAISFSPNTPGPSTTTTFPIFTRSIYKRSPRSAFTRPTSPLMPLMMYGPSMNGLSITAASPLFRSTDTAMSRWSLMPIPSPSVPLACVCTRSSSSLIPTATPRNAFAAPCLSKTARFHVYTRPIRQRTRLRQRCQLGSRRQGAGHP